MEWFIFALLTPIFWAVCNIIDKFILEKHIKNPVSYELVISLFNIINLIILLLIASISTNIYSMVLGILIGIIGIFAVILYNKSMIDEEASRVVPLVYIDSIFVVILAYIFLGEVFNFLKYLGIIFIVMGGILISLKKVIRKWKFSSAIKFILTAGFLWSVTSIISKYALGFTDYFSLSAWQLVGYNITVPFFMLSNRIKKNFLKDVKKLNKGILLLMVINTLFYLIALLSFFYSTSISSISLVYAVVSTQPFFIFIYTLVITKMASGVIKEEIDKSTILLKIIAICLIFLGTFFIGS